MPPAKGSLMSCHNLTPVGCTMSAGPRSKSILPEDVHSRRLPDT